MRRHSLWKKALARTGFLKNQERRNPKKSQRQLRLEALEPRTLLTAAPWQNIDAPLDTNDDDYVTARDMLVIAKISESNNPAPLPSGHLKPTLIDNTGTYYEAQETLEPPESAPVWVMKPGYPINISPYVHPDATAHNGAFSTTGYTKVMAHSSRLLYQGPTKHVDGDTGKIACRMTWKLTVYDATGNGTTTTKDSGWIADCTNLQLLGQPDHLP